MDDQLRCMTSDLKPLTFIRDVVPCTTGEFPRPAPRPRNSALKKSVLNLLGYRTPSWKAALSDFVMEEFRGKST